MNDRKLRKRVTKRKANIKENSKGKIKYKLYGNWRKKKI